MHTNRTKQPYRTLTLALAAASLLAVGPALAAPSDAGENAGKGDRPQRSAESSERGGPSAEGRRGGGERRGGRDMVRLLFRDIELTDSQRDEVREVMTQARDERRAWMEDNGEEIRELRERMQDAAAIRDTEAMQEIGQELRAMMSAGPDPMAVAEDVRGMLTAEQAEQFDMNLAEFQERMEQRRSQGRQNAGPGGERGQRGARGEAGERGPRGEGRDGQREGRGGPEGRNGAGGPEGKNGQGRGGDGIDREAIERRLQAFRERREAERTAPPATDDNDFSDEPAASDSDNSDQLEL